MKQRYGHGFETSDFAVLNAYMAALTDVKHALLRQMELKIDALKHKSIPLTKDDCKDIGEWTNEMMNIDDTLQVWREKFCTAKGIENELRSFADFTDQAAAAKHLAETKVE